MAAVVYNGLQTCLESQLREPRRLRLKLSSFPSSSSSTPLKPPSMELGFDTDRMTNKKSTTRAGFTNGYILGGLISSLDALSNTSRSSSTAEPSKQESTSIYVHPVQVKPSSMVLSENSLQLCSENLCNENGTNMTDQNCLDLLESKSGDHEEMETRDPQLGKPAARLARAKKAITMQSFPPPLTTIRGSESLMVRPYREEGRLVMEVVKVPSNATCSFQAERRHGRLRLCFLKSTTPTTLLDSEEDDQTEYEEDEGSDSEEVRKEMENDMIGQRPSEEYEEKEDDRGRGYFGDGSNQ